MISENTKDKYKSFGLDGRFGFGEKAAVIVVDFSNGFTKSTSKLGHDYGKQIEAVNQLVDTAHSMNLPVIFTTEGYQKNMKDAGIWHKKMVNLKELQLDDYTIELDERLHYDPERDTIVSKKGASAFWGTNLIAVLVPERVDTLIVTGCTTSGCVRATVVDACQYGFRVIVPREAVSDRAIEPHEANLFDMDSKYADVMNLTDVLCAMQSESV